MMRRIGVASFAFVVLSCANNVSQDRATGPDGRVKGARTITLENGEGLAKGIVTYPGGDRVDWKVIELPAGKRGRLDVSMKWTTPRPGLQLGFDVFDQWNQPVANAKGTRGRMRETSVPEAKGKYFVRVYAKGRGDAGAYQLAVAFKEDVVVAPPDPLAMQIPEPPRLPAVPGTPCETFDQRDPECRDVCPSVGAPPHWPACPNPNATPPGGATPPPAPTPAPTPPPPKPLLGRVINVSVQNNTTIITIGQGSLQGVDKTWRGTVMRGDTNAPIVGGRIEIIRVDKQRTIAKVGLTIDIVTSNPLVLLEPAP